MPVHYRIGSLEIFHHPQSLGVEVHYRIGSLEISTSIKAMVYIVHYRIGSLENDLLSFNTI